MTTEKHPIDQLFKERLGNFEQVPPVGLLDKINQEVAFRTRIRRIERVKTIVGIAAALLLVAMGGWYAINQSPLSNHELSQQIQTEKPQTQPDTGKGLLTLPSTAGQPAAENQKAEEPSTQQLALATTSPVSKIRRVAAHPKPAVQPAGKERETAAAETTAPKNADGQTLSQGEKKPESGANTAQRKNDYYADPRFAPASAAPASRKGNWSIRAEISPMFPSENLGASQNATSGTKSLSTVSGGMMASYQVNEKIKISSGIRFSQMKQGTHTEYTLSKTSGITYLQPVEKAANISGDVSLYLPSVSSIVYSNGMKAVSNAVQGAYGKQPVAADNFISDLSQEFKYLEVPIQATYKLIDQKQLSVGLTGGISTNFLIGNYASITQDGISLSTGNTNNIRKVLYSGSAGIELDYDLGKNLVLTVEPRIKQYLHSISSNDQVTYRPMQLGIFTGITYSFR